ncbi:hypothetical protein ACFOEE_16570 [Pseudoalteromonas fenneropenaei]|uniref:Uncharacterized protein n=1 Tax=Pseudoalteromonas fenneropenaei TaxID=1737459 RepID=A0ABV7CNV7_9GAMM
MTRLKTRMLFLAAGLTISAGVVSFDREESSLLAQASCNCQQSNTYLNNQACDIETRTSWLNWLSGKSSNAQFHYLDLLELLIGGDKGSKNTQITSQF